MFFSKKLWKRSFFYYFVIALIVLVAAAVVAAGSYLVWFYNIRELPPPPDAGYVRTHVRNGDIILRSGVGMWSKLFRDKNSSDKRFSHVGIVLVDPDGNCRVIHSEGNDLSGDGEVRIISLEEFVRESTQVGISRLRIGDPDAFAENARKFLDRPFDWKFDSSDASAVYCTELIELSLQQLFPQIRMKRIDDIIMPEACFDPHYFQEIPIDLP